MDTNLIDRPKAITFSGRGTAEQLLVFQRFAWSSITLSITRRCPLKCSHCITQSGPQLLDPILSVETAHQWASELPLLARLGLEHITFTGGEPLLALASVRILSNAAFKAGIRNYIVTSGVWASSIEVAQRIVDSLESVTQWDIGYDSFHAEGLPWFRLVNTLKALETAGAKYTVRICMKEDNSVAHNLLDSVSQIMGSNGTMLTQPVRALGRAEATSTLACKNLHLPRRPCVSTGLFVRADGSTGPCCAGLAYESFAKAPFDYGTALGEGGLLNAWRAWRTDPLLRLIRLTSLSALEGWLSEAGILNENKHFPEDPCEACVLLWRSTPEASALLAERAKTPTVLSQLDAVEEALYGKVWTEWEPR